MSAKNSLKGYVYQVNVLNAFVAKMDLKRNIENIESEAEVKHEFDDMVIIDKNDNVLCFQVKNYEKFDINKVTIEDEVVKIVAGNTRTSSEFDPSFINGLIVNKDFECDSDILGFKSKLIDGIHVIPLTENNYDEQVGEYVNNSRKEFIQTQVINKISNALFEFKFDELPKLSFFSNDLKHETVKFNRIPEVINGLSWHLGAPGTGKSHWAGEIDEFYENSKLYRFYADEHDQERFKFDNFLEDFTHRIFGAPEKKSYDEIVDKIIEDDLIILIDGVDHVYNYNPPDLEKFLEFFDILKDTKTLIFSRPFPEIIENDNVFSIEIWNKKDTIKYLEHYGFEEDINDKIYDLTNGYPIITYYLAEHYKLNKDLILYPEQLKSIEDYYQTILDTVDLQYPLELFLFCNSYILESEIDYLLDQNSARILHEFIEKYPYFFTKELNRIRLFHDSLFTYLHGKSEMNYDYSLGKVKKSILSKEINFLTRFKDFNFENEFIKQVLKLYSDFNTFEELSDNFDFESVKLFYINLRKILKDYPNTLDIYQYYSLILIDLILNREDYIGEFSVFYQIFRYSEIDETVIYSDGVLWRLYKYYSEGNINPFKKLLEKHYYDLERVCEDLKREWEIEEIFYSDNYVELDEDNIEKIVQEEYNFRLFQDYLAYIWINGIVDSKYFPFINNYINYSFSFEDEIKFRGHLNNLKIRVMNFRDVLEGAKLRVYQCGYLEEENIYLKNSLTEYIGNNLKEMSTSIYQTLLGYLRFYNNIDSAFDFSQIFRYFNMYSFRKDYSVLTINNALFTFEKHGLISERDSFNLILNTMSKSEKGIRHLSLDYFIEKSPEDIEVLLNEFDVDFESEINYFDAEQINKLPEKIVFKNFFDFNKGREIDFSRLNNILKSNYKEKLLLHLRYLNLKVFNVPNEFSTIFEENNVDFEVFEEINEIDQLNYMKQSWEINETEYHERLNMIKEENQREIIRQSESFTDRNYIKKSDFEDIKLSKINHLELAKYQDGNYDCLAYPDFFKIYDKEVIRNDLLRIIYNAITNNVYFSEDLFAITYSCLGNIPYLIDYCEYEVDWAKLFNIFKRFINESGIEFN
ncbi:hypothetical protein [Methanobrevibacter sp.]|uniref:hypothetical protein n=1 Tax=Methanobrevibacter sp. TaxID=66852 RepID=UPI002E75D12B|nr:hypothetical protein [Methanobrevibacter sp.]MEE0025894.1 hypothetical protein [Methanobrevibacter sp.]